MEEVVHDSIQNLHHMVTEEPEQEEDDIQEGNLPKVVSLVHKKDDTHASEGSIHHEEGKVVVRKEQHQQLEGDNEHQNDYQDRDSAFLLSS